MIEPQPIVIKIDDREIANAVVRYTLNRAASGPSSLVGGSLVTGASSKVEPKGARHRAAKALRTLANRLSPA
jgi:hypothetical protein